jgi:hypothetical protein
MRAWEGCFIKYTAVVDLDLSGTSTSELPGEEAPQPLLAEALAEIDLGAHDKEIAPVLDLPSSAHLKHSSSSGGEWVGGFAKTQGLWLLRLGLNTYV